MSHAAPIFKTPHGARPYPFIKIACFVLLLAPLIGCVGAAVGGGAAVGVAAMDERGVVGVAKDAALAAEIRGKYLAYDFDKGGPLALDVSIEVHDRRAMLTGMVKTEDLRAKAVRFAWEVEGVKAVYNEILVGDRAVVDTALDSWITGQLLSKMTVDRAVKAINYNIETVNGVVYLLGIAQDKAELGRVLGHARSVPRVRDIVSHVEIKKPADKTGKTTATVGAKGA